MKKLLCVLLTFMLVCAYLSGCSSKRFEFMHDTSEIASVYVIDYSYNCDFRHDYEQTNQVILAEVADVESFAQALLSIPRSREYMLNDMQEKHLAFKVQYTSGDYEILVSNAKIQYHSEIDILDISALFSGIGFDEQQFHALIISYLAGIDAKYTLMYDSSKISSVDFVRASYLAGELQFEVISTVNGIDEFIQDQQSLKYIYDTKADNYEHSVASGDEVFRITYENGSYELFGQTVRHEICSICRKPTYVAVNIGYFDAEEYASFEAKYVVK